MYAAMPAERALIREQNRKKAQRRSQRQRRRVIWACLTLLLVFVIGFGFGTLLTRAQEPEENHASKYYTSIEIQKGDTLWKIADQYMDTAHYTSHADYVNEVMSINHMSDSLIKSGHKLIIPYYTQHL